MLDTKKILKLAVAVVLLLLVVKLCSDGLGSVISLPGGLGKESTGESGGWLRPKTQTDDPVIDADDIDAMSAKDLERELGIGKNRSTSPSVIAPSTTTSSTAPLSFKGIPLSGTLSAFGSGLVKAGFKNAGNGSYTDKVIRRKKQASACFFRLDDWT
ncbi:MAG: hypothetical protein IJ654_06485 [Bacteroidales bacterium]|nr:hypothetical protein [Bacteroidales bacterium]